ncbi:MAG: DNA polymerase III subunit epsilon [Aquaspirillum sp.]|nr:DNA polymerase III subunit epsilon [Aquaspirillum sp.]
MTRQIILDTETTGLEPSSHRLIEFAGLEMVNRKLTGRSLHLYVDPQRDIDPEAQKVHGISRDMLHGKPLFADVADEILDFIQDAELIIHNAPFDIGFLNSELARANRPRVNEVVAGVIDTLVMAKERFPGKRNNLDILCDRFGVDRSARTFHGALIDCALLGDVYLAMTRGQESLMMEVSNTPEQEQTVTAAVMKQSERAPLPVLPADADELAAHQAYLNILDKKAGKPCVWRQYESAH